MVLPDGTLPPGRRREPDRDPPARRRDWQSVAGAVGTQAIRGRILGVGAGIGFGTLGIFSNLFYSHGGSVFTVFVGRFAVAGLVFITIALAQHRPLPHRGVVVGAIALGPAQLGTNYCLLAGFNHAPPGLVELMFYVYPLLVTLVAAILFREHFGPRRAALLAIGMIGIALTVGIPRKATIDGIAFGLGAGLFTAVYVLASRHLMSKGLRPVQFLALSYGTTGLLVAAFGAAHGMKGLTGDQVGYGVSLVVLSTIVPMLLLYSAIVRVGASTASMLATSEPLVTVILSYLVLSQPLTGSQLAGGALILTAVGALAYGVGARAAEKPLQVVEP